MIDIRLLTSKDELVLHNLGPEVFDNKINTQLTQEFLSDPRHHLVVALDSDLVVGMASGVHYVHPDKAPQMFINEVGVSPSHRGQGIGRSLVSALVERARQLNCTEAWVLTDAENTSAMHMYAAAGGFQDGKPQAMFTIPISR
jgi:ribosomal protein S18 acetylase RimI-like enzyme